MGWVKNQLPFGIKFIIYMSYFLAGCAYLFVQSVALHEFLGSAYYGWAVLLFLGSMCLLLGLVAKNPYIEVVGTLPTGVASMVYSFALLKEPPNDQMLLAIGLAALIGANFGWLLDRFFSIYPKLGTHQRYTN